MKEIKQTKFMRCFDKITSGFEFVVAFVLLVIIAVKIFEMVVDIMGFQIIIVNEDFEKVLSTAFALVIGVEFTKMLCKHTPETVIDVLVFALARQTVIYHESNADMLIGVTAIAGLFAAKKFLLDRNKSHDKKTDKTDIL